ncbi:MAG: class I SAM-dependent methyltransferase [Candidatus Thiodiazotropha sp. (ex Lucinoma aequizonata)]|nr:class I SAM-dependent methyltransferase [Candidatus Thiodiazotropha sp. (ex Lucinoma aequizonata)]
MMHQRLRKTLTEIATTETRIERGLESVQASHNENTISNTPFLSELWEQVISNAKSVAAEHHTEVSLDSDLAKIERLDSLCAGYVGVALQRLHIFPDLGSSFHTTANLADFGILPDYSRALTRLLRIGVESSFITQQGATFTRHAAWPSAPSVEFISEVRRTFFDLPDLFDFILRSGTALTDILTGKVHAAQMLFPDGRLDFAERIYTESPPFRYCNTVAAAVVRTVSEAIPADRPIHIAEVGGGTGATTASIVPQLSERRSDYLFSDISNYFLDLARSRFAVYPFMRYQLLDIEKMPDLQAATTGKYDIVIAAHILHATSNIDATLKHVRALLDDGGILILLEETQLQLFFNITMGLQAGFDRFSDAPLRTSHPLLTAGQWTAALQRHGFRRTEILPDAMGIQPLIAQVAQDQQSISQPANEVNDQKAHE